MAIKNILLEQKKQVNFNFQNILLLFQIDETAQNKDLEVEYESSTLDDEDANESRSMTSKSGLK